MKELPRHPFKPEAVDTNVESAVAVLSEENNTVLPKTTEPQPQATTTVPVEFMTQLLAMFAEKMNDGLSKVLQAARTAPIDPIKEKQRQRAEETKRETEEHFWKSLRDMFLQCSHLREDMTSCICWAVQSDNIRRGFCPHCRTNFSPIREECCCQEVFDAYKELSRIPTQKGNAVLYV